MNIFEVISLRPQLLPHSIQHKLNTVLQQNNSPLWAEDCITIMNIKMAKTVSVKYSNYKRKSQIETLSRSDWCPFSKGINFLGHKTEINEGQCDCDFVLE